MPSQLSGPVREFDHDRLDVYQRALDFAAVADAIQRSFPPGSRTLADQLQRSSVSIVLNIAEGAGEFAKREKARFYRFANRDFFDWAIPRGFLDKPQQIVLQLYSEPLRRFQLAAEGHGSHGKRERKAPDRAGAKAAASRPRVPCAAIAGARPTCAQMP